MNSEMKIFELWYELFMKKEIQNLSSYTAK